MSKVIIFGGAGFIGSHFKEYFTKLGWEVHSYDIEKHESVKHIDVRKKINIEGNFSETDLIVNLAATHRTPGHPDFEYFETNILGAEKVCAFAESVGIKNILFTSSIAPYGANDDVKVETDLPTPNTPYGISKLVAEKIHETWAAKSPDRNLLIIRPGVVFGKGENGNFTRLYKAISKRRFFYPGRVDTLKACIYVKDLVQLSAQKLIALKGVELYNFAYYPCPTIKEIADSISDVTNSPKVKVVLNAKLLLLAAGILGKLGFSKMGIHPDRVKKLMVSTNVSGEKLANSDLKFEYNLRLGLEDWYKDCDMKGLF
ncbi:MAG: SDR family oxidoreductase [bacterium]|nr:SDR family oxidoreductase [bacterium]